MGALLSPTSDNFVQKTLGAELLAGATTVTLNNVTSIPNLPGVFIVDRIDTNDVETPTKREVISYAGVSGSTLTGLTRNADGSGSDQTHAINGIVEFGPDILWAQSIYDALSKVIAVSTGLLDVTKVVDLATAQTLTNKTLTSPVIRAYDGWIDANETWTYASANTITVPSGAASKYKKGDFIKWTQTTVKYGTIQSVADTVLTIMVNTDFVVTNAAISANYYSHEANPIGHPIWYACVAPTFANIDNGSGGQPTVAFFRQAIIGNKVYMQLKGNGTKAGSGSSFYFTPPIARVLTNNYQVEGSCTSSSGEVGVISSADNPSVVFFIFSGSIADNVVIAGFGMHASYEF